MTKKLRAGLAAVLIASASIAATVERDLLYVTTQGSCGHCVGTAVITRDAGVTWTTYESGGTTIVGSNAVFDVAVSITLVDWISDSVNSSTYHYTVDDVDTPTKVLRRGTLALLLVDGDATDEKGDYSFTNDGSVTFSTIIYKEGTHAARFHSGTGQGIYSDANITETIESVQFWYYWPAGHDNTNTYPFAASINYRLQSENGATRIYNNAVWTGTYAIAVDTWYHIALEFGGVGYGTKLVVDGTVRGTSAATGQPSNVPFHFGYNHANENECDCFLDSIRVTESLESITEYPTIGDY